MQRSAVAKYRTLLCFGTFAVSILTVLCLCGSSSSELCFDASAKALGVTELVTAYTASSALSALLIFASAYSCYGLYALLLFGAWRGAVSGYAASCFFSGRLALMPTALLFGSQSACFAALFTLYVGASAALIGAGCVLGCRWRCDRVSSAEGFRYIVLFAALVGAAFVFDIMRGVLVCF